MVFEFQLQPDVVWTTRHGKILMVCLGWRWGWFCEKLERERMVRNIFLYSLLNLVLFLAVFWVFGFVSLRLSVSTGWWCKAWGLINDREPPPEEWLIAFSLCRTLLNNRLWYLFKTATATWQQEEEQASKSNRRGNVATSSDTRHQDKTNNVSAPSACYWHSYCIEF